jgi:hypothetical protein
MEKIAAVAVEKFEVAKATDDGEYGLLRLTLLDKNELVLAMKHDQLLPMVEGLALAHAHCDKAKNIPEKLLATFRCNWWQLTQDSAGTTMLSLTFGNGGKLHFTLPGRMPEQILETLQSMVTGQTPPRTGPIN